MRMQPTAPKMTCFCVTSQGPLFTKYNAVLRGIDGKVAFLRDKMIELCCSEDVHAQSKGSTPLSHEQLLPKLNKYTP